MPVGPTVRRRRLGAELRRLREGHSLKLDEVAERLGLAPSTLSRIETGKAPTKSAYLTAMLEMYEVEDPSSAAGCVEIAHLPDGGVAVRDSKDRSTTPHVFSRHEWECFLAGAKNGEFDLPAS